MSNPFNAKKALSFFDLAFFSQALYFAQPITYG